jgi:iron complex transport system ATP-binding protein
MNSHPPGLKPDIVEIQNATVYRGDNRVFQDLTLRVRDGEHTAILGPNGAGKSTLLKLLSREIYHVDRQDSWVRLFGQERWSIWDLRSHLGIISNDLQNSYLGHVTGFEVVLSGFYSSIGTWAHQNFTDHQLARVRRIITELDLIDIRDRRFGEMSTGQQRRFLLARALIHDPDALVLDEPTSGLDLKATFQYIGYLRRLMNSGHTVLLVTHHIHEIPPEVGRVVLLDRGKVAADGGKEEILQDRRLSELFGIPIHVVAAKGFYQVFPG